MAISFTLECTRKISWRVWLQRDPRLYVSFPPFPIGKAEWNYSIYDCLLCDGDRNRDCGLRVKCNAFDASKVEVSIHVFRSTDNAMFCLYDSKQCSPISRRLFVHPQLETGKNVKYSSSNATLVKPRQKEKQWPLKDSRQAAAILKKCHDPVRLIVVATPILVDVDQFALRNVEVFTIKKAVGDDRFYRFSGNVNYTLYWDGTRTRHGHKDPNGPTFLHILSELGAH